jgi:hypothetical protein
VPRFGVTAPPTGIQRRCLNWAGLGIRTKVVSLLPEPTASGTSETVATIAKAVGSVRRHRPPAVDHSRNQRLREAVLDAAAILMFEHGPNTTEPNPPIILTRFGRPPPGSTARSRRAVISVIGGLPSPRWFWRPSSSP